LKSPIQNQAPFGPPSPISGGYGRFSPQPPGAYPPPVVPPAGSRQHSPLPPAGTSDPSLFPLFRAVDVTGHGQLSEEELSKALVNDEYTTFDPLTVRMMIKMFDQDGSGTIGYEEFW
jgi:peflin